MRKILFIVCFAFLPLGDCIACEVAPKEKSVGELVTSNSEIVMAELSHVTRGKHEYTFHFKVLQKLKGSSPSEIQLKSCCNFVSTDTSCSIHPGGFALGGRYLLFITEPYDYNSFRPLIGENDEWLSKVKDEIVKQKDNRVTRSRRD